MRRLLALTLISTSLAAPAVAQSFLDVDQVSLDAGIGASYSPEYMGSGDNNASPWFILKNVTLGTPEGEKQGFSFIPSLRYMGDRDSSDYDRLQGLDDIDRAGELGLRVNYVTGPFTSYGAVRKGFGGHDGVVGEIGTKYRFEPNDKLTLWTGAELELGDDKFTGTYFGVSDSEAVSSGYSAYDPDGGPYRANISLEARYMLTPDTSLLGKVTYGRLMGDAADSPIVEEKGQPSISIGVARRLNFRF
ncbi:MipA/OmpV family protein [Paracoccus laeviglucosivorans]|uniref:Outer membrane protein n=1 Tax=Paracoccus laeviglucosivorans TaxID=1197861 RepID=A0A521D4W8_9RHOB|nr:MipA/OmpV family protein [Paracoccus laeviglucosivorans]SMO66719.1 outer membrane protein [Paracoccus laeviglucosivorans]